MSFPAFSAVAALPNQKKITKTPFSSHCHLFCLHGCWVRLLNTNWWRTPLSILGRGLVVGGAGGGGGFSELGVWVIMSGICVYRVYTRSEHLVENIRNA